MRPPSAAAKGAWAGYFAQEVEEAPPPAPAGGGSALPGAWRLVDGKLAFFPSWNAYDFDESKHPRRGKGEPGGGQFAPKGGGGEAAVARKLPEVKARSTGARAWSGRQDEAAGVWAKDRTGKVAEGLTIEWLKQRGFGDARTLNVATNNFPLDLVHDHEVVEVKAGLASNGPSAQQWRSTAGEPGAAEKAWLAKATPSQKAAWNARKQAEIIARKQAAAEAVSKSLGVPLKTATMGVIIHPASGVADIYRFDGFHLRIGWNGDLAKSGYAGSLRFKAPAFARYSLRGEAEDAGAGSAPLSAGEGPMPPAVWAEFQASLAGDARKWVKAVFSELAGRGGVSGNTARLAQIYAEGEWDEVKYPRDEHGRFITVEGAQARLDYLLSVPDFARGFREKLIAAAGAPLAYGVPFEQEWKSLTPSQRRNLLSRGFRVDVDRLGKPILGQASWVGPERLMLRVHLKQLRGYARDQDSTDYAAIEKGLDALEAELLPRLKRVFAGAQEKMLALVERAARGSGLTPRFVDGLEVRGLGDLVPLLRAYLRAAYGFGRREVGREIGRAPKAYAEDPDFESNHLRKGKGEPGGGQFAPKGGGGEVASERKIEAVSQEVRALRLHIDLHRSIEKSEPMVLYHWTSKTAQQSILRSGFREPRLGGAYGAAIYLSPHPTLFRKGYGGSRVVADLDRGAVVLRISDNPAAARAALSHNALLRRAGIDVVLVGSRGKESIAAVVNPSVLHVRKQSLFAESLDSELKHSRIETDFGSNVGRVYQVGPPQDRKAEPSPFEPPGIEIAVSAPGEAPAPSFFVEPIDAIRWFEDKAFVWRGILADDLLTDVKSTLLGAIRTGQLLGDTMTALRRVFAPYAGDLAALPDQEQVEPYRLETLVRTNTTEAFNQGRLAGAKGSVDDGFVVGWKWSAILDTRTTQVCRFLDGKILPPDGPVLQRLLPPRCWNCRSTLIPVTRVTTPEPELITPEEVARAMELSCAGFSEEARARAYAEDPDFESKHPRKGKGPGGRKAFAQDRGAGAVLPGEGQSAKSGEELIRGSSEIPLSPRGEAQVAELGRRFAAKGGVDGIVTSSLARSKGTARAIAAATGASILDETDRLQPWHLGGIEGQPIGVALEPMRELIEDYPDEPPPGRGEKSTADGESFNEFRRRLLGYVKNLQENWLRDPARKVVAVTHYRGIKAIQAWLKAGMPDDLSVDAKEMLRHDGEPGSVYRLAPAGDGGPWRMDEVDMAAAGPLAPGLYVTRHGLTSWNAEDSVLGGAKASAETARAPQEGPF